MTVFWFFLVISWNGEATAFYGFPDEVDCTSKRNQYATKKMLQVTRDITDCIGVPIRKDMK